MINNVSRHARIRMQQRAIPQLIIDCLIMFGYREPSGDGTWKCFFDKRALRKLQAYAGPLASLLSEFLNVYVVLASNLEVVTAARRLERIRRR